MIFSRASSLWIALVLVAPLTLMAASKPTRPAAAPKHPPAGGYKGAIVLDAVSGKVLFEDNADIVNPPASMTKLMTFAVLHDRLASGAITLTTPVTVDAADTKIGGTQVWLKEHETFPVEELVYAMMIQSANDAAHALSRAAAGSREGFVELMNAKAHELGMTHTTFRSPHGLPPNNRNSAEGDLTSPRDFAILAKYLLERTDVLKYSSVRRRNFGAGVRTPDRVIDMVNHNHLLGKFAGVDGLKTGFTNAAGFCLTCTALRNGRRVIVVTMGGTDKKARDLSVVDLLERGFAALPPTPAASPAATPAVVPAPVPAAPVASVPTITPAPKSAAAAPAADAAQPMVKFSLPKK